MRDATAKTRRLPHEIIEVFRSMAFFPHRQAFYVYVAKRWLFVVALITVGCSAQSPPSPQVTALSQPAAARLKRIIRAHFDVAPNLEVTLGTRTPSDFAGYD